MWATNKLSASAFMSAYWRQRDLSYAVWSSSAHLHQWSCTNLSHTLPPAPPPVGVPSPQWRIKYVKPHQAVSDLQLHVEIRKRRIFAASYRNEHTPSGYHTNEPLRWLIMAEVGVECNWRMKVCIVFFQLHLMYSIYLEQAVDSVE